MNEKMLSVEINLTERMELRHASVLDKPRPHLQNTHPESVA